ncbi:Rho GDP-dissociation inhibitor 1 [Vitis vinifera]|uniref:Rho GDP-dissociation inhibitor 1 n=1 Tax=Vitis vinifera TaxID=29760 RepID=A0A438H7X0_VITVI|nr:Rho GDP-dissociation inhibitor 1 [Vitis vinifera]
MSLAVGVVSSSKSMGFDNNEGAANTDLSETKSTAKTPADEERGDEHGGCENSVDATEEEEEEDEERKIELGPQFTLKNNLRKIRIKDDESLRRWKEQLLGSVDLNSVGETLEPDVKILELAIKSPGRPDIVLPIPESGNPKGLWFTLKEGSRYSMNFAFKVSNNIVSGLRCTNVVWKTGLKVDSTKEMLGTFSPQQETYTHEMPEETTHLGSLLEELTQLKPSFLMTITSATWRSTTASTSRKDWQS